jgi:hypothetical protein
MLTAADIEETVYCYFPFREGSWGLSLVDYRLEEGKLLFTVHLIEYENESFRDVQEFSLSYDLEGVSRERWVAYLEGWEKAFGSLIERGAHDSKLLHSLHCAPVLRDAKLVTADDFLRAMQDPRTLEAFRLERYPSLSPSEEEYREYLEVARPESREAVLQRRRAAYDSAMARHPAVAERIAATHGFVLPRHVALTWAFFSSLSEAEWRGLAMLDLYPGRLSGVLELFKDGGLDRKLKPGFDARMHQVRHEDVPELLLMVQDSQDRYSLFYDDPAHMPSGLVCSPRHGADGWWAETYLDGLRGWLAPIVEDPSDNIEDAAEAKQIVCYTRLLIEALDDFQEWAEQIREEDRAGMLWSYEERTAMAETACGVGIATQQGDASGFELAEDRYDYEILRPDLQAPIAGWIAQARKELQHGDPRHALALGRDLHASCREEEQDKQLWQREAKELLVTAYHALGREALASRVEVHHAHRALDQEDAYED